MTDKELLELAAKAADVEVEFSVFSDGSFICYEKGGDCFHDEWNPLTDDGDALRLAVKLSINIEHSRTLAGKPHGVNCWPVGRGDCGYTETDIGDYLAATRRAIVRAAAEIGKELK